MTNKRKEDEIKETQNVCKTILKEDKKKGINPPELQHQIDACKPLVRKSKKTKK